MIWPQPFSNSWWQANGDAAVDDDDEDDVTMVVPVESEKPDGELAHLKAVSQSLDRDDVGVSENPVNWPNLYYNMFSEIYLSGLKSQINICQNLYSLFITKLWRNRVHNPSSSWLILGNLIVLKSSNLGVTYGTRWLKWIKNHQKTTSCLAFARFLWCLWSQKGKNKEMRTMMRIRRSKRPMTRLLPKSFRRRLMGTLIQVVLLLIIHWFQVKFRVHQDHH